MTKKDDLEIEDKACNRHVFLTIFNLISLVASIIALAVALPRAQLGVDYLGIIVAILGSFATLLLAMQLYNVFSLKDDAKKAERAAKKAGAIEELYNALQGKVSDLEKTNVALQEQYSSLKTQFNDLQEKADALASTLKFVDSPEWIYLIADAKDRWLFGIRHDGSVDWQVGIPEPIEKELETLKKRVAELEKNKE